ncbi:hypothetical protein RRG08_062401 [Elysia crispata]|uniref:Uncharacterized protein n=1 Tax=Elysia crispata TaxID=231223 RepID=A0AAE1AWH0_9GAST|nr:hypothetical protein RRG08_062401 [Elysia crispata]
MWALRGSRTCSLSGLGQDLTGSSWDWLCGLRLERISHRFLERVWTGSHRDTGFVGLERISHGFLERAWTGSHRDVEGLVLWTWTGSYRDSTGLAL